jgi:hypothetical protein
MKIDIQVLSQRGRLIGVWVPPVNASTDPRAPTAFLRAGPGQKLHDVTVEIGDATFRTAKQVADLHATLRKKLKLKK